MKRLAMTICISTFLFFCVHASALEVLDLSKSQMDYGAYLAGLSNDSSKGEKTRSSEITSAILVLLRTDGSDMDFFEFEAKECIQGPGNRYAMLFGSESLAAEAVHILKEDPHVLYAETDCEITACETAQTDSIDFVSYGATDMGFGPLLSWARKMYGSCCVAVIDSGVYPHTAFATRLRNGWDYVDNDNDPTNDESGHGTHVAGVVADCTQGTFVTIYSIRVMNSENTGKASNAANGILEAVDAGIPVINLSFVSSAESAFLDDAVDTAVESGCTVIVAAGNGGADTSGICPAHIVRDGVIVVGAADRDGSVASYSNSGASVDLYAYGTGISSCAADGSYTVRTGTSQAAPHISAGCALLKTVENSLAPGQMETRLKTVLETEKAPVPHVDRLVPQKIPCHLETLILGTGESLQLPAEAHPLSCGKSVKWSASDGTIISIDTDGHLTALQSGSTFLTGLCDNFSPINVSVTVKTDPSNKLTLPAELTFLGDEALWGTAADYLIVGDNITEIGNQAVNGTTVIICPENSAVAKFAEENGLQYLTDAE